MHNPGPAVATYAVQGSEITTHVGVEIIGDSIVKYLDSDKLFKSSFKYLNVTSYPGKGAPCIRTSVNTMSISRNVNATILMTGSNDIVKIVSLDIFRQNYSCLLDMLLRKCPSATIFIFGIHQRCNSDLYTYNYTDKELNDRI